VASNAAASATMMNAMIRRTLIGPPLPSAALYRPNRYPKPRTIWTYRGREASGSTFARSRCTQASTSRESPRYLLLKK
jgi:hypothetical protein